MITEIATIPPPECWPQLAEALDSFNLTRGQSFWLVCKILDTTLSDTEEELADVMRRALIGWLTSGLTKHGTDAGS